MSVEPAAFLRKLFETAVSSASPASCMPRWLPDEPDGRTVVIGAGKAAASMARELEQQWQTRLRGAVIVPYNHAAKCQSIDVFEASHPVPDEAGMKATEAVLDTVNGLSSDDTVICLISGGGSSLLCKPVAGISLAEKRDISKQLLRSGAAIHEMNIVRKKLSAVKGGKLASAAAPARVVTIVISDVPGNDAALVASGPTLPDTASAADALDILRRYRIDMAPNVERIVAASTEQPINDADVRVIATSDDALLAASAAAVESGVTPYSLGDLSGDATVVAEEHAALALEIAAGYGPVEPPCVILSGGETTVTVRGKGRGGRNSEYALALALALGGHPQIHAIAGDTDGIDGNGDHAACFINPDTLTAAAEAGIDPLEHLQRNDSYAVFEACEGLLKTGPTLTNVNDLRAILITASD